MTSKEKFKHCIWFLVARLKRTIKVAQNNKYLSSGQVDDAYKMGYLMALYNTIEDIQICASDFDIEIQEIGLEDNVNEIFINFLTNLSYISNEQFHKRINFNENRNYDGEFDQINECLIDQCESLLLWVKFEEKHKLLLDQFYCHLEPFYQDYEGLYIHQRTQSWKEIVDIAKDILGAFDFESKRQLNEELVLEISVEEYDYLSLAQFVPKNIMKWLHFKKLDAETYRGSSHPWWVEEIRGLCEIRLQAAAFNEKHKPNSEGKVLESLIDKSFTD